jgi:hypothetical protein
MDPRTRAPGVAASFAIALRASYATVTGSGQDSSGWLLITPQ